MSEERKLILKLGQMITDRIVCHRYDRVQLGK